MKKDPQRKPFHQSNMGHICTPHLMTSQCKGEKYPAHPQTDSNFFHSPRRGGDKGVPIHLAGCFPRTDCNKSADSGVLLCMFEEPVRTEYLSACLISPWEAPLMTQRDPKKHPFTPSQLPSFTCRCSRGEALSFPPTVLLVGEGRGSISQREKNSPHLTSSELEFPVKTLFVTVWNTVNSSITIVTFPRSTGRAGEPQYHVHFVKIILLCEKCQAKGVVNTVCGWHWVELVINVVCGVKNSRAPSHTWICPWWKNG